MRYGLSGGAINSVLTGADTPDKMPGLKSGTKYAKWVSVTLTLLQRANLELYSYIWKNLEITFYKGYFWKPWCQISRISFLYQVHDKYRQTVTILTFNKKDNLEFVQR